MTKNRFRTIAALAGATGLTLALAACGGDDTSANGNGNGDGDLRIVTSTKVWGDIADAVVGDADGVSVEAIITSNDIDPHSYQPTAADMALVAQADILVAGGGHYDAWIADAASGNDDIIIVSALDIDGHEGHDHDHDDHAHEEEPHDDHDHEDHDHAGHDHDDEVNEHIWYDTDAVRDVAHELAVEINAHSDVTVDDEDVIRQLDEIDERKEDIEEATTAQTHPLADDILTGTAITDATPEGYRQATLKESEPSAADVAAMLDLIESGDLDFLIDAPQTSDQVSTRLVEAATAKGLRIVNVLEAPNADETYFDLYNRILDDLEQA
ncbi:metal ABC transporter solute-binding protein, Zn/Mn family [uncultured Corynebacterium sp.]|uniref:metal ABC transporter solute-binding protein, Zn/Mn family n=1 Tax=uncultured Corynebacterium sp. TaxID=159447 RepID=UPI00262CDD1A|nr:zinc ABC transporter substrate-binding protein [uncultured Corynebacterium sp.]